MQFKNPLKKEDSFTDKVKAKTLEEIKVIEQNPDPSARLAQYEALIEKVHKIYNGGKPLATDHEDAGFGAIGGGAFGTVLALGLGVALVPMASVPVGLAIMGGGIATGALTGATLGGVIGGRQNRKEVRAQHGSMRYARAMYSIEHMVKKRAEQQREMLRKEEEKAHAPERKAQEAARKEREKIRKEQEKILARERKEREAARKEQEKIHSKQEKARAPELKAQLQQQLKQKFEEAFGKKETVPAESLSAQEISVPENVAAAIPEQTATETPPSAPGRKQKQPDYRLISKPL